jgi:hypothetical protein
VRWASVKEKAAKSMCSGGRLVIPDWGALLIVGYLYF